MEVIYLKNGEKRNAILANEDLSFDSVTVDNRTTVILTAHADIDLIKVTDSIPFSVNFNDRYFLNGYQSWTDTREYSLKNRLRNIKKSPHIISQMYAMRAYGDSYFYDYSILKMHGYDVFYSKGKHESFIFNLNHKIAYLIIELIKGKRDLFLTSDVNGISLKSGESVVVFDYCFYKDFNEGLEAFNNYFPKKKTSKILGYTSWYNYYQNINEQLLLQDLNSLDDRFNLFQIDDGYQTYVGDWLDINKEKFPNGLGIVVEKIHLKGYKAGIWLAPFVAEKNSKLFKEHNDWIKKDSKGKLVKAGGNWSGQYALDFDKQEVKDYIKKCLEHYIILGFDFFKLDFLYAVGLVPSKGKTRSQTQREAYEFLRQILKDKIVLGCGANIVNSIGNFDYLRVGPDVSLDFDDKAFMRLFHRERISTKVTLQNTIFRSIFDKRFFGNDPDVFILRKENNNLSKEQRIALSTINALFGSILMTSDNINLYSERKKPILDRVLEIFFKGEVTNYFKKRQTIYVDYSVDGRGYQLAYNTRKGVLEYDR